MNSDERGIISAEAEQQPSSLTVRDVLYVLFRYKWRIVLFFLAVSSGGTALVLSLPDVYQSEARILIKGGRNPLTRDPAIDLPGADIGGTFGAATQNAVSIMQSPVVAEKVVEKLGVNQFLRAPRRSALSNLKGSLKLGRGAGEQPANPEMADEETLRRAAVRRVMQGLNLRARGEIVEASFEALDPSLAQSVLQNVVDSFREYYVAVNAPPTRPEFFEKEVSKAFGALSEKQRELSQLRSTYNITSIDDQMERLQTTIAELQSGIRDATTQISTGEALARAYEKQLASQEERIEVPPAAQSESPFTTEIKRRLNDLRFQEVELAQKYPDGSRLLGDVRAKIEITKTALQEEEKNAVLGATTQANANRPLIETLLDTERARLTGQQSRLADLQTDLAQAETELAGLRGAESSVKHLQSEVQALEEAYFLSLRNLDRSKTANMLDRDMVTNVAIIQPAILPFKPIGPQRTRNVALALFMGFFGSLGLAFLSDYLSHTFKTNEDVEKHLGLPVLATVSDKEFESCT